jgi:hypothetical protein
MLPANTPSEVDMSTTFEIEFPPNGPAFDRATNVIAQIQRVMGEDGFRLEPLVRFGGGLVEPWDATETAPTAYAYRIFVDPLAHAAVDEVRSLLFDPLAHRELQVREVMLAA